MTISRARPTLTCDTCGKRHTGGPAVGWYVVDTQTQCPEHSPVPKAPPPPPHDPPSPPRDWEVA